MSSEGGPSAKVDATRWLDLPARSSFTARTLETGRELRFEGAGRVRACGDDVALVAEGSAVGLPGGGEAPGAEQWVATACGVARWASGVHRLSSARDACRLQSSMGTAHLWVPEDVRAEDAPVDASAPVDAGVPAVQVDGRGAGAWQRVDGKRALRLSSRAALDSSASVKRAIAACEKAADAVQTLATRMGAADAGTSALGELAAESVVARGLARAACAVAAVRVALAGSRLEEQTRLDSAVARWRIAR
jgi:hypothetical protein